MCILYTDSKCSICSCRAINTSGFIKISHEYYRTFEEKIFLTKQFYHYTFITLFEPCTNLVKSANQDLEGILNMSIM